MSNRTPIFLTSPAIPKHQAALKEAAISYCNEKKLDPYERVHTERGGHEWTEERWVIVSNELADLEMRLEALYFAKLDLDPY